MSLTIELNGATFGCDGNSTPEKAEQWLKLASLNALTASGIPTKAQMEMLESVEELRQHGVALPPMPGPYSFPVEAP